MPYKEMLPTKEEIEDAVKNRGRSRIIFPDGECSYTSVGKAFIGSAWHSSYWGTSVVIVEMSGDYQTVTVWVEEVKSS